MADPPPVRRWEPHHLDGSKVHLHDLVHEPSGPSGVEGNGEEDGQAADTKEGSVAAQDEMERVIIPSDRAIQIGANFSRRVNKVA